MRPGQKVSRDRCGQHDNGVDPPPAILIGPNAEQEPDQRSTKDGRADQKTELGVIEPQFLLDADADDRKDRPDGEADRESDG